MLKELKMGVPRPNDTNPFPCHITNPKFPFFEVGSFVSYSEMRHPRFWGGGEQKKSSSSPRAECVCYHISQAYTELVLKPCLWYFLIESSKYCVESPQPKMILI